MSPYEASAQLLSHRFDCTYILHNVVDRCHHIVEKVARVQAPRLGVALTLDVLFHHLVVQEPQALGHVSEVGALAPHAEKQDEVNDATRHGRRRVHGGVHLRKVREDRHRPAPLDVVGEDLGVERVDRAGGLDRRGEDVAAHVPAVVAEQDEQVLGLVPDRRILKAEEVPKVLARRVDHVGVLCQAGRQVRRVEHVEGVQLGVVPGEVRHPHPRLGLLHADPRLGGGDRFVPRPEQPEHVDAGVAQIAVHGRRRHEDGRRGPH